MKIDAIILSNTNDLAHYGLTCRTINSLRSSVNGENVNIIVVESQSQNDFKCNGYMYPDCNVIFPEVKFEYNKFLNIGMEHTTQDWVMVCNNDLFFTKNWFNEMEKAIIENPNILSFSPKAPTWHLHLNTPQEGIIEGHKVSYTICGWCILFHKSIVKICDLFDENFKFWYQDNDYAMSLQKGGVNHALVCASRVYHIISGSHDLLTSEKSEYTDDQYHIYAKKWGPK